MEKDEQLALAKEIFTESGQKAIGVDNSKPPSLVVSFEDEYGRQDCTMELGDMYDETELRRSLESFKHGRAAKIAEWKHQKKQSAEIVSYLEGEDDPKNRMRWLPKLVAKRFLEDFRLRFPELQKMVDDPENSDKRKVLDELKSIPPSWQHNP